MVIFHSFLYVCQRIDSVVTFGVGGTSPMLRSALDCNEENSAEPSSIVCVATNSTLLNIT